MPLLDKIKAVGSALGIMSVVVLYVFITHDPIISQSKKEVFKIEEVSDGAPSPSIVEREPRYLEAFEYPANPKVPNLQWTASVTTAVEQSRRSGKRIFLAIESVNSIYAAQNRVLFAQNRGIQEHLQQFVLLALFIDDLPEFVLTEPAPSEWREREIELNREIWLQTIPEDARAPNYAIVEPTDSGALHLVELSPQSGYLIGDPETFVEFLNSYAGKKD